MNTYTTKLGPTGELPGARPTPLNTLEGTSMSTIQSIGHTANDARSVAARAVAQFQAGKLTANELAAEVSRANYRLEEAVAAVPVPTCPAWCDQPAGHPHEYLNEDDGQVTVTRWHKRVFYNSRHLELFVEAEERTAAGGSVVGAPVVSSIGELERVSAEEARVVASALAGAAELLDRVGGAR